MEQAVSEAVDQSFTWSLRKFVESRWVPPAVRETLPKLAPEEKWVQLSNFLQQLTAESQKGFQRPDPPTRLLEGRVRFVD